MNKSHEKHSHMRGKAILMNNCKYINDLWNIVHYNKLTKINSLIVCGILHKKSTTQAENINLYKLKYI